MYDYWNNLLFRHFFNEGNAGIPVILYIDKSLLDDLGKDLGGMSSFIESIIFVDNSPIHIVDRWSNLLLLPRKPDAIPPDFNILCLSILTWTVDATLQGGNFYDRLNGLLKEVYENNNTFQKTLVRSYMYNIGKGIRQQKDNQFRILLKRSFHSLQIYTNETLEGKCGIIISRQVGNNYVGIPKAHALVNAKDRSGLEKLFFSRGLRPGSRIKLENAEYIIENGGLRYFSNPTRNRWANDDLNKLVIKDIFCSLLEYWDGTIEDEILDENNNRSDKIKFAAAHLVPSFRLKTFDKKFALLARIEFYNRDFPVESSVLFKVGKFNIESCRQISGWSLPISLVPDAWNQLLNFTEVEKSRLEGTYRINFFKKPVYILKISQDLGGYIPTHEITSCEPYLVFAHELMASDFLKNNSGVIKKVIYDPSIDGWGLYKIEVGETVSLDGLGDVFPSPQGHHFELQGGAKIGHGARRHYSAIAPPQILVTGKLNQGFFLCCRHGVGDIEPLLQVEGKTNLFELPSSMCKRTMVEILLCNQDANIQEETKSISFTLEQPSMPDEKYHTESLLNYLACTPSSKKFLYNPATFKLSIEGGYRLEGVERKFLSIPGKSLPNIRVSHLLKSLKILCNEIEVQHSVDDETVYSPQNFDLGQNRIAAYWHGIELTNELLFIVEIPRPIITVIGAKFVETRSGGIWFCESSSIEPKIQIEMNKQDGPRLNVVIDGEKKCSFSEGIRSFSFHAELSINLLLRWGGHILAQQVLRFESLPLFMVSVLDNSGRKWSGSEIYDPDCPPDIILVNKGNPTKSLDIEMLEFSMCGVVLQQTQHDGNKIIFSFPAGSKIAENIVTFEVSYYNIPLQLTNIPAVCFLKKPVVEIKVEGSELEIGVFSDKQLPRIFVSINNQWEGNQPVEVELQADDQTIPRDPDGYWYLTSKNLQPNIGQHYVTITVKWFDEVLSSKMICISRKPLVNFRIIGGTNMVPPLNIFPKESCPLKVEIQNYTFTVNSTVILFYENGTPCHLEEIRNGEFSLGIYDKSQGKEYTIELRENEITIDSCRFSVAKNGWQQVGFRIGEISPAGKEGEWLPCWFLEKKGRKDYRLHTANNCPEAFSLNFSPCPCDSVIKDYKTSKTPSKEEIRGWKEIFRKNFIIKRQDMQRWALFRQANRIS